MWYYRVFSSVLLVSVLNLFSCIAQTEDSTAQLQIVGGSCEGCEAALEYGEKKLSAIDTLPGFEENSPKIKIEGTVYQSDGVTPANNIILYIYHTDRNGIYPTMGGETGWAKRHGYIRGWIKTSTDGKFAFYTFRPASYPNRAAPQHIHITVKEPDKIPYYIDDYMFEDDPLLSARERNRPNPRGGSGIIYAQPKNGILTVSRDIVLGLNIPDYNK